MIFMVLVPFRSAFLENNFVQRIFDNACRPRRFQPGHHIARDALFDVLIDSNRRVAAILEADKNAANGKDVYDDDYFGKFFTGVKPLLERQLGESIAKTAALITGAWMEAGKPALVTTMTRAPEKVRRP